MREGHGIYVRANGNRYDGQFANDDLVGHGIFTFAKDNSAWSGDSATGIGTWHFDCD